jgi:hypothetical protein
MNEHIISFIPFEIHIYKKIYPFSDENTTTSHNETLHQEEQVVSSFSSVAVMLRIVPALPAARATALGARRTVWAEEQSSATELSHTLRTTEPSVVAVP